MSEKQPPGFDPGFSSLPEKGPRPKWDVINEIPTNDLKEPQIVRAQFGPLAYGTDIGYGRKEQQDGFVINTVANGFAVIDAYHPQGALARDIVAKELKRTLQAPGLTEQSFENLHVRASRRIDEALIPIEAQVEKSLKSGEEMPVIDGAACYLAFWFQGDTLHTAQAGDVRLLLIDRDKHGSHLTKPERDPVYKHIVTNSLSRTESHPTFDSFPSVVPGDRIIVASDGLWDSIEPADVIEYTYEKPIEEAINALYKESIIAMQNGEGKPDNITILIYDIERL